MDLLLKVYTTGRWGFTDSYQDENGIGWIGKID